MESRRWKGRFPDLQITIRYGLPNHLISGTYVAGLLAYSCGDSQGLTANRYTLFPFNPYGHPSESLILS